jgi:hypothetical protein
MRSSGSVKLRYKNCLEVWGNATYQTELIWIKELTMDELGQRAKLQRFFTNKL